MKNFLAIIASASFLSFAQSLLHMHIRIRQGMVLIHRGEDNDLDNHHCLSHALGKSVLYIDRQKDKLELPTFLCTYD